MEVTTQAKRAAVKKWLGTGSINIFGIQFSGKDTQCRRLAAWLDGPVIGGGEIMRNAEHVPQRVRDFIDRGDLAPFDDYVAIMTPYFAKQEFTGRPLLLSTVGRGPGEEPAVMKAAESGGHPLRAVVWLDMPEETVWERRRLMREIKDREARVDDDEDGLRTRLNIYKFQTVKVREYYDKLGLVIRVDAEKSPEEVETAVLDGLYKMALRPV